MDNTERKVLAGVVGGLAGAMAMGMMMAVGKQTGMVETPPPVMIERELESRAGLDERTTAQQEVAIASGGHLLLGAALGAAYGLLREPLGLQGAPGGAAYGVGVYAANFAGIGPALDLTAGPWNNEAMTVGRRVMMHLLFGAVTAAVTDKVLGGA